jgi:hypothetical protein
MVVVNCILDEFDESKLPFTRTAIFAAREPFPKERMACLRLPPLVVPPVETGCNRRARERRTP